MVFDSGEERVDDAGMRGNGDEGRRIGRENLGESEPVRRRTEGRTDLVQLLLETESFLCG